MKCPRCGSANRADARVCFRCGQPMEPVPHHRDAPPAEPGDINSAPAPGDGAATLWEEPPAPARPADVEQAARSSSSVWDGQQTESRRRRGQQIPPLVALRDDEDPDHTPEQPRAGMERLRSLRGGQDVEVVLLKDQKPHRTPQQARRLAYRRRRVLASVALLVVLAGVGYGGFRLFVWGRSTYRQWRQARIEASLPKAPLVERVMLDGTQWHKITFYGQEGERVMLENPQQSKAIRDGVAEFFIEDSYFLSKETENVKQTTVSLKATLYAVDGSQTVLDVEEYIITVPESPLKVIYPAQQDLTTNENRIPIKLKTTPGSRVLINGDNVSDYLDTAGYLSLTVMLQPIGNNNIDIVIETPGHHQTQYALRVNRPALPMEYALDKEPPANTYDNTLLFTGTIEPGSRIETDASLVGAMAINADGTFTFTIAFRRYGENLITLDLTAPGDRTAQVVYRVNRTPKKNEYSNKAWAMDYSYLSTSPNALVGRVFMCQGKVIRKLDVEGESYYEFNVGTDETPQLIIIEYTTDQFLGYTSVKELETGKEYTLFADVIGTHNDYPLLVARDMKLE